MSPTLNPTVSAFSQALERSPQHLERLRSFTSPLEVVTLAQDMGFELSPGDTKDLFQQAYLQWWSRIDPQFQPLFDTLRTDPALNHRHRDCKTPADVLALAAELGYPMTLAELQTLAAVALAQPGFSCEKLWFQSLGLGAV
ncbi:Nif11-like leader peptide family natural product precursor [Prochlorothrix hollandica]|uniref:Nif11 domain-containing protein n=1 Tax=Prochlorothrix hollandica PCC 9006 = CALU 1027 TaxID=317619 RepID=A0A0M2PYZ4_PROHO|nr:Nif11-like leader peptide family natural product precursor [Prochlorothrix hollandica]KKI99611.1 hypothetical protein PROH_06810 [Prochlorothrix hollandica PCC 9006 = CALU 1027]